MNSGRQRVRREDGRGAQGVGQPARELPVPCVGRPDVGPAVEVDHGTGRVRAPAGPPVFHSVNDREAVPVADLFLVAVARRRDGPSSAARLRLGQRGPQAGRSSTGRLRRSTGTTRLSDGVLDARHGRSRTGQLRGVSRASEALRPVVGWLVVGRSSQSGSAGSHVDITIRPDRGDHRHEHRALQAGVRGDEPDERRADQEGGVPEADHQGQPPATADVPGEAVDLRVPPARPRDRPGTSRSGSAASPQKKAVNR